MNLTNNLFAGWRQPHVLALIASLIAHFFLVFFFSTQIITMGPAYEKNPIPKNLMKVSFLKLIPKTSEKPKQSQDEQKAKPQKLLETPLPVLTPKLKPQSDAIHYFDSSELSEAPHFFDHLSNDLSPALTGVAPQTLSLRLQLNKSGEVEHVILGESQLSDTEQQLLVDTLFNIKFKAGQIDGASVYSELHIEIAIDAPSSPPIIK